MATAEATDGKVDVWLDREFADRLRIETVTPEPESTETSSTRVTYTFEVEEAERRARISFAVLHQGIGSQRGVIGIPEGPSVSFRQFILP